MAKSEWYSNECSRPSVWLCKNSKKNKIKTNIIYQDNMSALSLAKNGYVSSSKRTKHIKAKYFFIHHFHNTGELDLQYCPTEQMWANVLTKPLQGQKFREMHSFLMNCPIDYSEI